MTKIEKIAALLGITLSSEVNVELAEATTDKGVTIYTENEVFEVGALVTVAGEDDVMVAAPAGEHVLTDGTTIIVDEAGVITEVKVIEENGDDAAEGEEVEDEELSDDKEDNENSFAFSEEDYNTLLERIAKLEAVLLGAVEALSKKNSELSEEVQKLSAMPAAEPLKPKYKVPTQEENALAAYKRK